MPPLTVILLLHGPPPHEGLGRLPDDLIMGCMRGVHFLVTSHGIPGRECSPRETASKYPYIHSDFHTAQETDPACTSVWWFPEWMNGPEFVESAALPIVICYTIDGLVDVT